MSLFPKIQSPCSYKGPLSDILDQDSICSMCNNEVHDITALSDDARVDLVSAAKSELCVSYRVPAKALLAKSAMAAATLGSAVAFASAAQAQDNLAAEPEDTTLQTALETADARGNAASADAEECYYIIVGGLRKPDDVEWLAVKLEEAEAEFQDAGKADMPVIYENNVQDKAFTADTPAESEKPVTVAAAVS